MKLLIIRIGVLFVFIIIFGVSVLLLPTSKENVKEGSGLKEITSSLPILGSDKIYSLYQSINFIEIDKSTKLVDKISLSDFLTKATNAVTQNPVAVNTEPLSNFGLIELKKYGNEVGEINNRYFPETLNAVAILERFVTEPENLSARTELVSLSKRYTDLSNELLSLETPLSISSLHKNFIDVHKIVGMALKTLSENAITEENLLTYNKAPSQYIDAYLNVAQYLRASGIRFDEDESGSLFTLPF